jgi:hypothetical protein
MDKNCSNCANNTRNRCIALSKRIKTNCFAWADTKERIKRIDDMINYSGGYLVSQNNRQLIAKKNELLKKKII